jgi:hypothetical protein
LHERKREGKNKIFHIKNNIFFLKSQEAAQAKRRLRRKLQSRLARKKKEPPFPVNGGSFSTRANRSAQIRVGGIYYVKSEEMSKRNMSFHVHSYYT